MTDDKYLVLVSTFSYLGPARIKLLLSYFGNAKKIWKATGKELMKTGLNEEKVREFDKYRIEFNEAAYFNQLKCLKIGVITIDCPDYPENLKDLDGMPPVLYVKGNLTQADVNAVAVVGSRKMTAYGREVAEKFSKELAGMGATIVSGLARGVDTAAHKGALAAGGRTIAVMGCGLDRIYPPENAGLAKEIIDGHGAVISEYPLGYPALPENFAARNRIISGLSKGVMVIEGAERSGTLLTASHAAEQGRTVFAVPGQITSPLSFAPLYLIKNGAKMVTEVGDILEDLSLTYSVNTEEVEKIMPGNREEEKLLTILENESLHVDEVARISAINIADVSARLTIMELKGLVKNVGNGVYKKN